MALNQNQPPVSLIISAYLPRGIEAATALAFELSTYVREVFLIINSDFTETPVILREGTVTIAVRPNIGMNIGAWVYGASLCNKQNHVLCIQDECVVIDANFAQAYSDLLSNPSIGLIGESLNPKWDFGWEDISRSPLNYSIAYPKPTTRVDFYLNQMRAWGIEPGRSGRHVRALVWGLNRSIVDEFAKMKLGRTKEECIASEIAVSKLVENKLGLQVLQSSQRPFKYFQHSEWEPSGMAKKRV